MYLAASGIQTPSQPLDGSAFAAGVPSLKGQDNGDFFLINDIVQIRQPLLKRFQLVFVGFLIQREGEICMAQGSGADPFQDNGAFRASGPAPFPAV